MGRLFLLALLACGPALALGQITKSGSGYRFRAKYKSGQVIRLASSSTFSGAGTAGGKMTSPVQIKVASVRNGIADLRVSVGPTKINGAQASPVQPLSIRVDTMNRPVGGGALGSNLGPQLPSAAIKIGHSWSSQVPVAIGAGNAAPMTMSYRFTGFKKVGKTQAAVLALGVRGFATGSGLMTLSMTDGMILGMTLKMTLATGGAPLVVNTVVNRR